MHTIATMERLIALAETMGYEVRYENLGGVGGGRCAWGRRKCLFLDLALNPIEQLEQLRAALLEDPSLAVQRLPEALARDLGLHSTRPTPALTVWPNTALPSAENR